MSEVSVHEQDTRRNKIKVLIAMSFAVTCLYVVGGVLLLIGFFTLYAMSLSWGELSYVLPLTAGEYVLVTILAYVLLGENVLSARWARCWWV